MRRNCGFVRGNGHLYAEDVEGDLDASVRVAGEYRQQYDQAGLMVYAGHDVWLKCGIEFVDGGQQLSAVVTRQASDWSCPWSPHRMPCGCGSSGAEPTSSCTGPRTATPTRCSAWPA